jgi:hypothetical protein
MRQTEMSVTLPFLTAYDPPGTSEGTIDPLGLYQIADQLGVQLVPGVRERMQRIRFLTAMAVGALVTEGLQDDRRHRDASPYLVWEWLVVEAVTRTMGSDQQIRGIPGTLVAKRALDVHGYLDARSYLKTPRIFGFNGVYKRLAIQLGLVDVHLGPARNTESLVDAWARGLGLGGLADAKPLLASWSAAVRRCLAEDPPRTKCGWSHPTWGQVAQAFAPHTLKGRERRHLRDLLLSGDSRPLGALPAIWRLQSDFSDAEFGEEPLHDLLGKAEPSYAPLLDAIRAYEGFVRSLQDAFDVLKAEAARTDAQGFVVPKIASDGDFVQSVEGLPDRFLAAHRTLGEVNLVNLSLQNLFDERFGAFSQPLDAGACAVALCTHHERVQRGKSADGKRPWFDRLGGDRIYVRHRYREPRREIQPGRYVHDYRGKPIRRFHTDLS